MVEKPKAPLTFADFADMPVAALNKIGPKKAAALAKIEITHLDHLLTHYPRKYIDRTREAALASLSVGEEAMVLVRIRSVSSRRTKQGRAMTTVSASDGTAELRIVFFNQPWRERQLSEGTEVVVFGKLEDFGGRPQMTNPVVDVVGGDKTGRIIAVYPQSDKAGIASWEFGDWIEELLRRSEQRGLVEPLPDELLVRHGLMHRGQALRAIHLPSDMAERENARRRLVFDELLRVQLALVRRKRHLEKTMRGIVHVIEPTANQLDLVGGFHDRLPFPLTGAQQRAIEEIEVDLGAAYPMHRLLQGDVGAGKTVVAVSALLAGIQGGHQGALMAPTEVLAEQHHLGIRELLDGFSVPDPTTLAGERELRVALLANRIAGAERKRILADLAAGTVDLVIGTHALIQDKVEFASLGVVVIDEQHRFGVEQRAALKDKTTDGTVPDVLVMTATPIPRTAAMTVYGDLDVSILDELPPGRTPIITTWAQDDEGEERVWEQIREEVANGRQAYVVCPLIEESEKLEVRSALETYEVLRSVELAGLEVGLLHGRVPTAEKEEVMRDFREGRLDVLVATTVIEVGVDVPNATTMAILDASRFGIAQLHQLRGRVGRGGHQSYCHLVGEATTPDGEARLEALVASTDGFELAEIDLDLRGEGTLMGERQKGRNDLKLASLRRDRDWVERARATAFDLVDADATLQSWPALAAELEWFFGDAETEFLLKN